MQLSDQSSDFFHFSDLEALTEAHSEHGVVFSLYLDLRHEMRTAEDLLNRFNLLLIQTEQQTKLDQAHPEYREQWDKETERIRRWLVTEQPMQANSLVVFSSIPANLWRAFRLSMPVMDRLVVSDRPFVQPLEVLLGEHQSTLAVLVDTGAARFVQVSLGSAEEMETMQAMPVTGGVSRDDIRQLVEQIETVWNEQNCDQLLIGGSHATAGMLRDQLPDYLSQRLVDDIELSPQAELAEVLAEVKEVQAEREREVEAQHVEELISKADNDATAVFGVEQSLLSVRAKKVRLLLVEEDFRLAGGECPNCGFLGEGEQTICLLCGMQLRPEVDIIEVAMKRVLDHGGEIDVLRSPEHHHALKARGHIGALLFESGSARPERETANQQPLTKDGEIRPQALHDEAIEESFPASDPPSWSHFTMAMSSPKQTPRWLRASRCLLLFLLAVRPLQ